MSNEISIKSNNIVRVEPRNDEEAINVTKTIFGAIREKGREYVLINLVGVVAEHLRHLKITSEATMSNEELIYCVRELSKEYGWMSPKEFVYVIKQGVLGRFGANYNRLDISVIGGWFYTHAKNTTGIRERKARESIQVKESFKPIPQSTESIKEAREEAMNKLKKLEEKIAARRTAIEKDRPPKTATFLEMLQHLHPDDHVYVHGRLRRLWIASKHWRNWKNGGFSPIEYFLTKEAQLAAVLQKKINNKNEGL